MSRDSLLTPVRPLLPLLLRMVEEVARKLTDKEKSREEPRVSRRWYVLGVLVLVLATAVAAEDVGFRQVFPPNTVYDLELPIYNLTTPFAAEQLGGLVRGLDVPLTGRRLGIPIYIVDGPNFYTTVEEGPRGPILVHRRYLEGMTGVAIKSRDPKTVDGPVRAIMNSPARRRAMESIIAHELGHQTQAHGRFRPSTGFAAAAQDKVNFLVGRMNAVGFYR